MALPLSSIAPGETGAALGNAVDEFKIVGEIRHARVSEIVANAADVHFGKMVIERLLQEAAPTGVMIWRHQTKARLLAGSTGMGGIDRARSDGANSFGQNSAQTIRLGYWSG